MFVFGEACYFQYYEILQLSMQRSTSAWHLPCKGQSACHLYNILEPHLVTTLISAESIVKVVEYKKMQTRNVMCILKKKPSFQWRCQEQLGTLHSHTCLNHSSTKYIRPILHPSGERKEQNAPPRLSHSKC